MLIRQATEEDIDSIVELESITASPWSKAQIAAEISHSAAIVLISAAVKSKTITGWCSLRHLEPEAELLKIAVHRDFRRSGLGSHLLREALQMSSAKGCRKLFLEVRAANHPARTLYHKLGFKEYGIRKKYYNDPLDDAILYTIEINELPDQQSRSQI